MTDVYEVEPLATPPDTEIAVPGSKSLTNRALVTAALAEGVSHLTGVLAADDTDAMVGALRSLGIAVDTDAEAATATVTGCAGRLPAGPAAVDVRLSGTTARFVAPLLAAGAGSYTIDGGAPFRARPMGPTFAALRELGADVTPLGDRADGVPARIDVDRVHGGRLEVGGDVSSQFLSGLLLAAPAVPGGLEVAVDGPLVSVPYVHLTLATMAAFGVEVAWPDDGVFRVPAATYRATRYAVEPDASAASYLLGAAAITGGRVRVRGLGTGALQGDARFADVLAAMGAEVHRDADGIEVRGTGHLRGIEVDLADLSDTAQTLAAVAVFADGPTRVTGIGFIRRKETDRIAAVVTELRRCGIDAEEEDDGFVVHPGTPTPATVETYDDHRMAMSFALLGLRVPGIAIADPGCVAKTFPDYFATLDRLR